MSNTTPGLIQISRMGSSANAKRNGMNCVASVNS